MARFYVNKIIDGDTFQVSEEWAYKEKSGTRVRIAGINTPEKGQPGYQKAKDDLSDLILGEYVELKNAKGFSYGRLVCDVFLDGVNIVS